MVATRNEKTGDIIHPALVYVISPESKITYTFNNPSPKWLSQAVQKTIEKHKRINTSE